MAKADSTSSPQADIGLWGLAVMGENLILNMESKGFTVAAFNRTTEKTRRFAEGRAKGKNIIPAYEVKDFIDSIAPPRKVMIMVKAGKPVDMVIEQILPYLEKGDLIIDGGNSYFGDTIRRCNQLKEKGLLYIGTGVSGGEEGALKGPSIMPGGSQEAYALVEPIFTKISAKVDGEPCCTYIGDNGAGHYVKMVHNGIEYGDMELICEAYNLMKTLLGYAPDDIHKVFADWNDGELNSYLIEITRDIMAYKDEDDSPLVEKILDTAGQKGTGKWTGISSLELGVPVTLIAEAVYARCLSALKDERVAASKILKGPAVSFSGNKKAFIENIRKALFASKIVSYAQGFMLLREAAKEYHWNLNYGGIALIWRGGCIIRSVFLGRIKDAFAKDAKLHNLLLDDYFRDIIHSCQKSLRKVVSTAVLNGVPVPTFSTAVSFYDSYRSERLPANLLQAQRDYFGAHTYERIDKPRGEFFHTNWTGHGGTTASTTYTV